MNRKEMLLTLLSEECAEVAQRVSKILRFGMEEIQPEQEQPLNNKQRLEYELNDLVAVVEYLKNEGLISNVPDFESAKLKIQKIEKYLKYSEQVGTLTKPQKS